MVLQALTGIAYEVVQASWRISTITLPLFLLVRVSAAYLRNELSNLEEDLLRESKPLVGVLVLAGSFTVLSGLEMPRFMLLGDLIAVLYFAFLFWKF